MWQSRFIFRSASLLFLAAFAIFSTATGRIYAQGPQLNFKRINNENGLSNSTIETIFQDSRGFMWFGTRDGLNRFDGYQMLIFKYDASDSNSIGDSYITSIYEDGDRYLWVGTLNGLNRFDPVKNSFTRYYHQPANPGSLSHNQITKILGGTGQKIWIGTWGGGINLFDPATNRFTLIHLPDAEKNNHPYTFINTLFEDSKGNTWAGTEGGLLLYNNSDQRFVPAQMNFSADGMQKPYSIRVICEDKNNNLLLGTSDNGLIIYDPKYRTQKQFLHDENNPNSISSNLLRAILVNKQGAVWTGTVNGGLDFYDSRSDKFVNYQYQPDNPASLSQRTVSALYEDRQGNIWIGTHRGGVNLYMPGIEKFNLFQQRPNANSLSYNDVKSFCEDRQGNIWIGTDGGGLNLFDRKKNTFKHFKYDHRDENSIGSNEVINITEDSQGNLWIATWGGGLCRYNKEKDNFIRYRQNGTVTAPKYIQHIYEDSKKNLWVATYFDGLYLFNRQDLRWSRMEKSNSGKTALSGKNILCITEDRQGNTWIGTDDGGLNRLDAATKEFSHYFNSDDKKPDLRVLYTDSKGNLWAGQSGLFLYDRGTDRFKTFDENSTLSKEFIKGIAEDNKGNLWISTSNGITLLNPEHNIIRKYNTADGLQGLEFEANAFLKTTDGQLFFGGINGFNAFYPNEIVSNSFIPPVFITDFQINNKHVLGGKRNTFLKEDISYTNEIRLSYSDATFSFGFAALNYTVSENNQYAYKLQNWDKDWINAGNNKQASYTNVSPGTYTFYIKASNNDGVWNEKGDTLIIIIEPPFWRTWWFEALVFLILSAAAFSFYRFRRKLAIERYEEKKKEEMHELQLQFFTNISHEFRTPLSLIAGPIEKLMKDNPASKENHTYKVIQKNTNRLLQLINELMDFRKAESGILKLQVMQGNIPAFLEELSEEFSELAQQKHIQFSISEQTAQSSAWFDRQVLEKIIINLLSNSFKYTPDHGTVTLEVLASLENFKPRYAGELILKNDFKGKNYLYFRVADNGSGISKESLPHLFERYYRVSDNHLGSGIGLAFVKNLTQLHKGNIYVYSERNKGTEIIIGIPCNKADYNNEERWLREKNTNQVKLESLTPVAPSDVTRPIPAVDSPVTATLLIADDNAELRLFLKEVLETQYRIVEATDGKIALDKLQDFLPDIIISDIMMPVMDGIEFCRNVKTNLETSHIPFILLTAKDGIDAQIAGTGTGADYYFSKPVSMELLQLTIRNILLQKQKLKERYQKDYQVEIKELVSISRDKEFMDRLISIIEENLARPDLDIDFVCTQIGMSRTKLYNKIKGISGLAIGDFIRTIRLKKAAQLMAQTDISITEVMYSVGIQTQSYFSKAFKTEFGKTPTQFLKELEGKKG